MRGVDGEGGVPQNPNPVADLGEFGDPAEGQIAPLDLLCSFVSFFFS